MAIFVNKKSKPRYYKISLLMLLITSIPISSKLLYYIPTSLTPKYSLDKNINAAIVLTAGIHKNLLGEYTPSKESIQRALLGSKIAQDAQVPLILSGGRTIDLAPSEAIVIKNYLNLKNSIIDEKSLNTYDSSININEIYIIKKNYPFVLITEKMHSVRAYLAMKSRGYKVYVYDYNQNNLSFSDLIPSVNGIKKFNTFVYETIGIIYYLLSGKITFFN